MAVPSVKLSNKLFGDPVLRYANSGMAGWSRGEGLSLYQKGGGWLANLYGGAQSGDDWAAVYIPVDELSVLDFDSAIWTYYLTNAETMGVNIVIWIHDPKDFGKRAEVTQVGGASGLAKAQGWNSHVFNTSTTQMFYYGENVTGTDLVAGTQYTWAQFQADALFKYWTIYRISIEYGWEASGTFDDAWVSEIKLNGQIIPLVPQPGEPVGGRTKTVYQATAGDSTTRATIITPAANKRVRIKAVFMATASATAANFELYFHTGANITTTPAKAIMLVNLDTDTVPGAHAVFGDDGPVGDIGEVVSIRTSVDITTNGSYTVVYKEE